MMLNALFYCSCPLSPPLGGGKLKLSPNPPPTNTGGGIFGGGIYKKHDS